LADSWCDTTTAHGKLLITILGGMAEYERSLIPARTSEGRTRGQGERSEVWKEANPHTTSTSRGVGSKGRRGGLG
jgi:DNA invertase Pin-like site-specific DNA recombinase